MTKLTHEDYCQFLLVSQTNFTQTYFADNRDDVSHDDLNRMMRQAQLSPRDLREKVRAELILSENGYVLFDDVVLDKNHSFAIEVVRRQWSGNARKVIKGIGVVTCVYVNPDEDRFWVIDFRIYDPDRDGKSKIDHVLDMWQTVMHVEQIPFRIVLMDSWYATMKIMKRIEADEKIYYCPLKSNRQISLDAATPYQRVDSIEWTENTRSTGLLVHLKQFPKGHQVKLFRIVLSTQRTEYVVTNDITQDSASAAREETRIRWKIEEFHRQIKQISGIEACQCRKQRAQRNHILCAMLVWVRLTQVAQQQHTNVYQLKQGLLDEYIRFQLRSPSISFCPA